MTNTFTTGAFLVPVLCADGKWRWAVEEFGDDTFRDGEVFNPQEAADTEAALQASGQE